MSISVPYSVLQYLMSIDPNEVALRYILKSSLGTRIIQIRAVLSMAR